eukprot:4440592-Amphidinium_carterae.1
MHNWSPHASELVNRHQSHQGIQGALVTFGFYASFPDCGPSLLNSQQLLQARFLGTRLLIFVYHFVYFRPSRTVAAPLGLGDGGMRRS